MRKLPITGAGIILRYSQPQNHFQSLLATSAGFCLVSIHSNAPNRITTFWSPDSRHIAMHSDRHKILFCSDLHRRNCPWVDKFCHPIHTVGHQGWKATSVADRKAAIQETSIGIAMLSREELPHCCTGWFAIQSIESACPRPARTDDSGHY